jgi:hypothetical protein
MASFRRLCIVGITTAALVALVILLQGPVRNAMARYWLAKLDSAPDEEVPGLVAQLAELGDSGIPALAAALGSQREIVARHARRQFVRLLDRWKHLDNRRRTPKLARLAQALAAEVGSFGPTARSDAAHLATRILQWPLDPAVVDRAEVIAACETVVRAARAQTSTLPRQDPGLPEATFAAPAASTAGTTEGTARSSEAAGEDADGILRLAELPGGGLDVRPATAGVEVPETIDTSQVAKGDDVSSGRLAQPWPFLSPSTPALMPPGPLVAASVSPGPEPFRPGDSASAAPNDAATAEPPAGFAHLSAVDTYELTRLLKTDKETAARAREELARRGWGDVHLELAEQLHDPDPAVRRRLARVLPMLESVNAVPWLWWLARDADAEVRLAALGSLATTGDPVILERVLTIARTDADERVRRQATLIARRRGGARQ